MSEVFTKVLHHKTKYQWLLLDCRSFHTLLHCIVPVQACLECHKAN